MTYIEPLLTLLVVGFAVWLWRYRRSQGHRFALLGFVFLVLISWPPLEWLLSRPLEARYPITRFHAPPTDAIVVLAGGLSSRQWGLPFERLGEDSVRRCELAAWIFHRWGNVPVLVSGGPTRSGGKPVAVTLKEYLERAGVDSSMIWTEERSHSTRENALYSADILRRHGVQTIALVVDMQSMRRAEASFRKEGFQVVPAPSEYRDLGTWAEELLPSWKSIRRNEITLHETLGIVWYRLHGWI